MKNTHFSFRWVHLKSWTLSQLMVRFKLIPIYFFNSSAQEFQIDYVTVFCNLADFWRNEGSKTYFKALLQGVQKIFFYSFCRRAFLSFHHMCGLSSLGETSCPAPTPCNFTISAVKVLTFCSDLIRGVILLTEVCSTCNRN